jgi:hypothetical protein
MKHADGTTVPATNQIPDEMSVPVSLLQCLQRCAANVAKQQPSRIGGMTLLVVSGTHFY